MLCGSPRQLYAALDMCFFYPSAPSPQPRRAWLLAPNTATNAVGCRAAPGESVFVSADSQPPVPVPVKMKGVPAFVWNTYLCTHTHTQTQADIGSVWQRWAPRVGLLLPPSCCPCGDTGQSCVQAAALDDKQDKQQAATAGPPDTQSCCQLLALRQRAGQVHSCVTSLPPMAHDAACATFVMSHPPAEHTTHLLSCNSSLKKGAKKGSLWFCPGTFMARSTRSWMLTGPAHGYSGTQPF
jgi:hypothetical protein